MADSGEVWDSYADAAVERLKEPAAEAERDTDAERVPAEVEAPQSGRPRAERPVPFSVSIDEPLARFSESVKQLRRRVGPVAAGSLIGVLLRGHPDYLGEEVDLLTVANDRMAALGPVRSVEEHLATVHARWDSERKPVLSGRLVILGLALDREVGGQLLRDGVIGALLSRWRPGLGTADQPYRLVWDVLSDHGRELAEEQPLLAVALGAPAEASVSLPAPARAMAWSPGGHQLAVLAGGTVYETRPDTGAVHQIGEFDGTVGSIGWGGRGVVGLSVDGSRAKVVRVRDGTTLGNWDDAELGMLSGDGSHVWLQTTDGAYRWAPPAEPVRITSPGFSEPATPVAVDRTGLHGLLRLPRNSLLVAALPPGSLPGPSGDQDPYWPDDAAPMVGWGPPRSSLCALVRFGDRLAVVSASRDGLDVWQLRGLAAVDPLAPWQLNLCRIATGPGEVSALAVDPTGTRLAAAIGSRVAVWSLAERRPPAASVPGYDSDRPDQVRDLLGADRDAQAIAALASARDVHPPLSIGLFGAWGSGKSFVLERVATLLEAADRPEGYLRRIQIVRFNAWQYAETNLWASLVDRVLEVIAPVKLPESPPEVTEAATLAEQAAKASREAAGAVQQAARELTDAQARLVRRRRRAALLGVTVLVLAAVAVIALLLGAAGRLVAAVSAVLALLSAAAGLLGQVRKAKEQAANVAEASRSGIATIGRLLGRPEELAVQAKGAELRRLQERQSQASAEAERLSTALDRVAELARTQPLGALLHRLATISDYRDQLSLVTRTRNHFGGVNKAIQDANEPDLERVVIVIDDLDRCPPEKVVSVLEAVHLLFDFEMFVVLIAVDTRWLEQSLRIRYGQLLGGVSGAAPTDYLEKIIQVPLQLRPLNESLARAMIAGLAGVAPAAESVATPPAGSGNARETDDEQSPSPTGQSLTAGVPRVPPKPPPAEVMQVTAAEATAMSAVASLAGTTPRAVKRFVNTYRLVKALSADPGRFDEANGGLGDHEVAAFLLALVTGQPEAAEQIFNALVNASADLTAEGAVSAIAPPAVQAWLTRNRRYADAPATRYAGWAAEASRYSFTPPAAELWPATVPTP